MNNLINFKGLGRWEHDERAILYLDSNYHDKRYAIGKNSETLALHSIVPLDGIIDDFATAPEWHGIPLVKSSAIDKTSLVANCSTSISPVTVDKVFQDKGFINLISLNSLITASDNQLGKPTFCQEMWDIVDHHNEKLQAIYADLSDDESRTTFLDTIAYRLYLQPQTMKKYKVRIDEQYFEAFMEYSDEVFVDAGGFDGDTTQEFADRYPDYRKIYLIEPSTSNMTKAKARLHNYERIEYVPCAVSDQEQDLVFDENAGSASTVSELGTSVIKAVTIDSITQYSATFIKMDLEGWELNALKGAKGTISQNKPKLAIAVYHSSYDYLKLYNFIKEINPDYKVYLRHYTEGWSETIMFFK